MPRRKKQLVEEGEAAPAPQPLYKGSLWKGVKPVYTCLICSRNKDTEDEMILHVLTHIPLEQRSTLFDELVKIKGE